MFTAKLHLTLRLSLNNTDPKTTDGRMASRPPWKEARVSLDGTPTRVDGETIVRAERGVCAVADTLTVATAAEEARSERVRRSKEALSWISSTGWDDDAMLLIGTRDPGDGTTVRCDGNPTRASSRRFAGGVSAYLDDEEEGCDGMLLYGAQMELGANDPTIETLYQPGFIEFLRRSGAVRNRHAWVNASRRCRTNWHYDNYENVLIVLAGSKRVEVRGPYMDALGGGDCKTMSGFYASGTEASNHGIEGLDGAAFSREFELNVCDALYIPSGWAHRVESEPFTVAVSHWWKRDDDDVGGSRLDGSIDARKKRLREWVNDSSSTSERRIRRRASLMKDSYPFRKEFEHQLDVTEFFDDPLRETLMDDDAERDVFDDILNADDDCVLERVVWAPPRRVLEAFFPSEDARKGNWKKTCSSAKYGYENVPRNFTTLVNLARERAVSLGDYSLAHRVDVAFQAIVHAVDDSVAVHRADSCIRTKENPWPSAYEWLLGTNLDDWHRWNDARRKIPPNASHYFPRSTRRPIPADFVAAVATNARYAVAYRASRIVAAHLDSGFDVTIIATDAPNVHERDKT